MARDGSGNYTRVEGPYVNGNVADAGEMNNELDDLGDAVSDSINIAGTKAFAANQPMGGFKLTGLAAGTTNGDSVRYEQLATSVAAYAQPLDATLTALAALSYTSGTLILTETASDTFALVDAATFVRTTGVQSIGGAKTFTNALTVNLNAASPQAPETGTYIHISGADSATCTQIMVDGYASTPSFKSRRANTTAAAPSALSSGQSFGGMSGMGYGASAYSGTQASIDFFTSQIWTNSAFGCYGRLRSTPNDSTTIAERYRWGDTSSNLELGYRDGGPGSTPDTAYTFALTDRGTPTDHSSGSAHDYTVPPNSSVVWPSNSILFGYNSGAGAVTIKRGSGVTFRNAAGTDADVVVAQYGMWVARRVASDVWAVRSY